MHTAPDIHRFSGTQNKYFKGIPLAYCRYCCSQQHHSLTLHTFLYLATAISPCRTKTGHPLKLSRAEPGQYLDGRPPGKTWLLLEEVLVRPAGGAHPVVCVGPNAPV